MPSWDLMSSWDALGAEGPPWGPRLPPGAFSDLAEHGLAAELEATVPRAPQAALFSCLPPSTAIWLSPCGGRCAETLGQRWLWSQQQLKQEGGRALGFAQEPWRRAGLGD